MEQLSILLLEDSALDADLAIAKLIRGGIRADVRRVDTRAAFEQALQAKHYDIILADYCLPDFDGLSALAITREKQPDTPFIFVSGMLGEEIAIDSLQRGATDYVLKQRLERLAPAVKRALAEATERQRREQTEAALRESEERYRFLLDSVKDHALFMTDREGIIATWNSGAARLLGYAEEEIIGQPASVIFTPEDRARNVPAQELATAAREGRAEDQRWHLRRDGTRFWADGSVTPVLTKQGELRGFVKVMRDNTARHWAEEELRHTGERLQVALSAAQMGTWRWDLQTGWETRDESLNRLFGLAPEETVQLQETSLELVHPEDRTSVQAAISRALQEEASFEVDFRLAHGEGAPRWLRSQGRVLHNEQGKAFLMTGACVDITERKLAEEAISKQAEELARSNADLQQFAYVTSHDLQEPLRTIASFTQLLSHRYKDHLDPEAHEYIRYVVEGARHMKALIEDLLTYSRVVNQQDKELARVPLSEVLHWTTMNLQVALQDSQAHLAYDELPVVQGDQLRLVQLLQNLIGNAIKYRRREVPLRIVISSERQGDQCLIAVRDNGQGFDPQYAEQIFGVFKRLHGRDLPGTGIGLAICKKIVEQHGGHIWAEGQPGGGATLFFTLPLAADGSA